MHRRQLLARVATTGLVLVGGARFLQARPTGSRAVDLAIVLKAKDEASAVLREVATSLNRLNTGQLKVRMDNRDRRFDPFNISRPYIVGEQGPELFVPHIPAGPPRTDVDYERLAKAIAQAIKDMPPPSVRQ